jgi:PAS domain S-box-containing protein
MSLLPGTHSLFEVARSSEGEGSRRNHMLFAALQKPIRRRHLAPSDERLQDCVSMEPKTTILVTDHNHDQLNLTSDLLRKDGYRVFSADSTRAALDTARMTAPDIVLLDTLLPGLHGPDICKRLKSPKGAKVIRIATAVPAADGASSRDGSDADGCLVRPFTSDVLRVTVRTMVRLKRTEDELRRSEELLGLLFADIRDARLLVDNQLRIIEANPMAADLFGYKTDELRNVSLSDIGSEDLRCSLLPNPDRPMVDQVVVFQTELRRKNGTTFGAEFTGRCFLIDSVPYREIFIKNLDDDLPIDFISRPAMHNGEHWNEYSWEDNTFVTSAIYAGGPISRLLPDYFEELTSQYSAIIDLALEQRAYKIDHNLSGQLRQLAGQLGRLRAAPRDVIELHASVLKRKMADGTARRRQTYNIEGRFMLVELLGYLANYYRDRAINLREIGSEQ